MSPPTDNKLCDVHDEQIHRLRADTDEQWEHINKIEDALRRLVPVWVTIVLMMMSGVTGSALTFAGMIIKLSAAK